MSKQDSEQMTLADLAAILRNGFDRLNKRFDEMDRKHDRLKRRQDIHQDLLYDHNLRLKAIES
jgi:hypothetical protein